VKDIAFGHFRLDFANECLWQDTRAISLRPKAFAVLKLLIERPGQLVKTQELLDAVWPGTFVGDAVLKTSIRQLREALDDSAGFPSYIETAHRRGYRFVGKLATPIDEPSHDESAGGISSNPAANLTTPANPIRVLGREAELAKMGLLLDKALAGERQIVFVTGEAGIGKTTVVEAFLEQAARVPGIRVVQGQCLEHFGSGEPYLPVLDGFSRLCRSTAGAPVVEVLRERAPSWLAHISPALLPGTQPVSTTRERMLREMAEALESLSENSPLLLVLEDLHWSDYATLDLIGHLSRRKDPAHLMIIGTYRPVDVILTGHPLKGVKRELQAHRLCHELALEYLAEEAVTQYLAARFPGQLLPARLRRAIYRRTEGNPLFMVNLVEYLMDEKVINEGQGLWEFCADCSQVEHGIPLNIRELIEKQIERLSPDERMVLEAASVSGMDFCAVAVAAGLDMPPEWVEKHCEELARRYHFLSPAWLGELPDGTISPRHRFNHVLYREVPYSLIAPMRRSQIHQRIAERGMALYGERSGEIAAELAMHFEQSRDWPRALEYLTQAARTAYQRSAHHEAAELTRRGLGVLRSLPETSERAHQEIKLRMLESTSLIAIKGFVAAEVDKIYALGKELLWSGGPSPELFNMHVLLVLFYMFSGKMKSARETAEELLRIAEELDDSALIMEAHRALGATLVEEGQCTEAIGHFDQAISLYPENRNHPHTLTIAHDCKVICECFTARALWALGDPDGALERMGQALAFAEELAQPRSRVLTAHFAAQLHQLRGEPLTAQKWAREVARLADEYGMDFWVAFGKIDLGWAKAELGDRQQGIAQIKQGLEAHMATGARLWCPHFLGLLAEQFAKAERMEEALAAIEQGLSLAEETGEHYAMARLQRIKNELAGCHEARKTA
jgi:DNA-binding winged helix-turn-helix (wHTH) protein/tetratricopeptide (TPR) repeat protein